MRNRGFRENITVKYLPNFSKYPVQINNINNFLKNNFMRNKLLNRVLRCIWHPVKQLWWGLMVKKLTCKNRWVFLQKSSCSTCTSIVWNDFRLEMLEKCHCDYYYSKNAYHGNILSDSNKYDQSWGKFQRLKSLQLLLHWGDTS